MNFIKKSINIALIVLLGIIAGFVLIVLTYLLPTNKIKENVEESIYTFYKEKVYYAVIDRYPGTQLDNYTDAIMLSNAMYDGNQGLIDKAINVYKYSNDLGGNPAEQLVEYFSAKKEIDWKATEYSRYWHGYLVLLKPALLIFNYSEIRMTNQIIQTLLIVLITYLLIKRNLKQHILPFIIAILSIMPSVIALSLQFSTTIYISLLAVAAILLFHEKLQNKYIYFFLILGMITSFLDFLTCPILTLGMPMMYFIILKQEDWKKDLKNIIILSIMWGIGYAGIWVGKWIISSILLQENFINSALSKISERTGDKTVHGNFTKLSVLELNLKMISTVPNVLIFTANIVYIVYKSIKEKIWQRKNQYLKIIPFLVISIMPFAWYVFAGNHSFMHYWFTYRSLAVTVCAVLSGLTFVLIKNNMEKQKI